MAVCGHKGVRVLFELAWRDVWRVRSWPNLGGRPSPATHRHPHQVPFVSGECRLFRSVGMTGSVRFFSATRVAGGCGVEACPWLERGLVRVRVRVTLDDGGHRYSQREQLMSDHSHDQLTVPNNLHDREPTNQIRSRATATYDLHYPTDEHVTTFLLPFATDRASQHTHLQPVAPGGVSC